MAKRQNQHDALPTIGRAKNEVLEQAGITTQDASRAEQIAAIPETEFEDVLATKEAKQEPVSAHAVKIEALAQLGDMLESMEKNKGKLKKGPVVPSDNHGDPPTLAELGIDKKTSMVAQHKA